MYAGLQLECWNCGSDDHINRDCPHAIAGLECWNCGGGDHIIRDCPHPIVGRECWNCGGGDHQCRDCPNPIAGLECWNCGGNHLERNCPEHQDTRALAAAGLRDAHDEIRRLTDNETITAIIDSCDSLILEFECGNPRNDEPDSDGPPPLVTEDDIHHGSASASSGFANINVGNVLVDSTGQILSGATRIEASAALEAPVPAPAPASSCGSRPRALTAPHYRNPDGVFVWFDGKGRWRDDSGRYAKAPTNRDRISAADLGSSVGSSKPDLGSSVESVGERLAAQEHAAAVRDAAGLARPGPASAPASSAAGTQRVAIRISGDRLSAQRWCEPPISAADLGSSVGSSKPDLGSSVESGATAGSWVQVPAVEGDVSDGPLPDVR